MSSVHPQDPAISEEGIRPPDAASGAAKEGSASPAVGGSYLGLWRKNRDFRLLFLASMISLTGDWFLSVALLDLVLSLTGMATLASLVNLCMNLPVFLVTPWAGRLADRMDRKKLMIVVDLIRAGAALMPLLATTPARLPLAYLGIIIISLGEAFFDPAAQAALPNVVSREDLGRANTLIGSVWGTMMVIGSALGGLVTMHFGRTAAFAVNSASFVISALLVWRVRARFSEDAPGTLPKVSLRQSLAETAEYARRRPQVMALLVAKAGYGLGAGMIALLAIFGREVFGRGAEGISYMLIARGLGALIGPFLLAALLASVVQRVRAIAACVAIFSLSYLALSQSPTLQLGMAALFVAHMGGGAQWQASTYGLQATVPDKLRGRILSIDYGLLTLALSFSSVLAGVLADRTTPRTAMACMSVLGLLWSLFYWLWTRRLFTEDLSMPQAPALPQAHATPAAPPETGSPSA